MSWCALQQWHIFVCKHVMVMMVTLMSLMNDGDDDQDGNDDDGDDDQCKRTIAEMMAMWTARDCPEKT